MSALSAVVLSGLFAQPAPPAEHPQAAVRYARNAFEYRDFEKTVEVLWPWLHPPRLVDEELTVEARELLGVSLFQIGREDDASEEFGALLLLSPDHELDPFVVPPDVISRFESVKAAMEPRLRVLRERRPLEAPPSQQATRVEVRWVEIPHWSVALIPFGAPQYVLERPAWGVALTTLQLAGLGFNLAGFARADALDPDSAGHDAWVAAQYAGLSVAVVSYVVGVVHASNELRDRREKLLGAQPQ